ncbi:HlyD family type I secretion periplasmic adaptor subunit [Herbaspirillum sp. WKF16]|uniref:HlyD family type I secretion periplasmic adaptor subunit n=1 Tax=Herbaspirillum sp. WKF16 TaxID=3028312 RepID=UPI0023A91B1A|nr:HlyD family type I secretion periplasmic adaptor subunit [Herbaspirillum sp. WKF16]WDZ98132.1 HlyD family type I secretion periplasmic adaptor subunit [Herbaspirillum sp. WKF16]
MSDLQLATANSAQKEFGHAFSSAAISIQARPPAYIARMVTLAICAMAFMAAIYAFLAHIDIVVSVQGRVIPSGKSKVIQSLESGVVKEIFVKDGQKVASGTILLTLDQTTTDADRRRLQYEYWESEADVARLNALLQGKSSFSLPGDAPKEILVNQQAILTSRLTEQSSKMASLDADVARRQADYDAVASNVQQIRVSLPLVEKKHQMREELAKTGHIAETGLIETKLELINLQKEEAIQQNRLKESGAGMRAAVQQKAQALAEFRARASSELVDAIKKVNVAKQELVKATQRRDLQVLKAPIDGVVQQLAVTTVGGVVTPAQPLMSVVPENSPLEVEAQVNNRDIGHVRIGQRVIAKIETFDFTRYGYIEGTVQWVGTDAVMDQKLGPIYPVRIQLKDMHTPNRVHGNKGRIVAGMNVTADIKTDERRMIEYFLAPMLRYKEESLRER